LARAIDPERLGCAILLSSAARDWDNSSGSSSSGNGGGHKSPLQRGGGTAGTEQGSRHRFSQQKSFAETEASVGVESLPRGGVSANLYVHGDRYRHESQATYRQASLLGVQLMFEALNAIGVHPGRIHHWDLCDGTDADVDVAADIQDLLSHLPSNIPDALIYYCGPATAEGHWSLTWRCPEGHLRRIIVEPDDPLGLPEFNLLPPPEVSVVGSRIFVTDAPFTARNWVKPALRQRGIAGLEGAGLASTERGPALTRWVVGEFAVPPRGVVAFVDAPPDVGLQRLPAFNTLFWAGLPSNLDDVERLIWELEEFLGAATQHERRLAANLELFSHGGAALMLVYLASFGSAASDNLLLHILWLLHSFLMSTPLERWAGAMDEVLEAVLELPNSCGSRHIQPNQGQQQDQQMHAFQGLQQQQILSQQSDGGVRGESDATSRHSNCSPSVLRSCLTLATACIARCSHCQERCGGDLQPKVLSSIMRALGGDAGPKFVDAAAAAAGCRLASQLAHQVTLDFEHHSQLVASLQLVLCRDPRFDEVSGDYDDDKFKAEEDLTAAGAEALFYACIRSNAMKLKVLKLLGTSGRLQLLLNLRGEAAVAKLLALLRTIAAAEPPESVSEAFNETIAVEIVEAVNRFSEEAAVQRWGLAALGALVNQDRNFGRAVEAGISDCVLSSLESSYEGSELAAMQEALFCAYALLHSGVGNLGGRPELATLTGQALRCSLRTTMTVGSECTAWSLKVLQMLACKAGGQAMVEPFLPDIVEAMLSGSITFNACEAACATISFLVAGSVRITASLRPIKSRLVRAVQLLSWAFVEAEGSDCRKVKSLQAWVSVLADILGDPRPLVDDDDGMVPVDKELKEEDMQVSTAL